MATATSRTRAGTAPTAPGSRRAYWRAVVATHQRSGLSLAAFCRRRGLRKGTLGFWRWTFAREAAAAPRPTPPTFVPIQLAPPRPVPGAAGELEITLGPGRCVRVRGQVEAAWLAQVLRAVQALSC